MKKKIIALLVAVATILVLMPATSVAAKPPFADIEISGNLDIYLGDSTTLTADWSTNYGRATNYSWAVDEDVVDEGTINWGNSSGEAEYEFAPADVGDYEVTFRVWHYSWYRWGWDSSKSVVVHVTNPTYTLTYSAGEGGSIEGTSPQTVERGSDGTAVTAVPDLEYYFYKWSDDVTANPRTDTNVTSDIDVTALFTVKPVYTITASSGENGRVSPAGEVAVIEGESQVFSIIPDKWYEVDDVLVDGEPVGAVDSYTFDSVMTDGHSICAYFKLSEAGWEYNMAIEVAMQHLQVFMVSGFGDYRYIDDSHTVYGTIDVVGTYGGVCYRIVIPEGTEINQGGERPRFLWIGGVEPLTMFPEVTFSKDCYLYKGGRLVWDSGHYGPAGEWTLVRTFR